MLAIIKKYKGYITLSVIFIAVIIIMYFTIKSKTEYVSVSVPDTTATKKIDSLKFANAIIENRINDLQLEKDKIKYIIINNQKNYENEINNIENTSADSNYINLLNRLGAE